MALVILCLWLTGRSVWVYVECWFIFPKLHPVTSSLASTLPHITDPATACARKSSPNLTSILTIRATSSCWWSLILALLRCAFHWTHPWIFQEWSSLLCSSHSCPVVPIIIGNLYTLSTKSFSKYCEHWCTSMTKLENTSNWCRVWFLSQSFSRNGCWPNSRIWSGKFI